VLVCSAFCPIFHPPPQDLGPARSTDAHTGFEMGDAGAFAKRNTHAGLEFKIPCAATCAATDHSVTTV
jgi:hypothetical protein